MTDLEFGIVEVAMYENNLNLYRQISTLYVQMNLKRKLIISSFSLELLNFNRAILEHQKASELFIEAKKLTEDKKVKFSSFKSL